MPLPNIFTIEFTKDPTAVKDYLQEMTTYSGSDKAALAIKSYLESENHRIRTFYGSGGRTIISSLTSKAIPSLTSKALGDDAKANFQIPLVDTLVDIQTNLRDITGELMPKVVAPKVRYDYYTYPLENFTKEEDDLISTAGYVNRINAERSKNSIELTYRGLGWEAAVEAIMNDDSPIAYIAYKNMTVNVTIMNNLEKRRLALLTTSGNYAAGNAVALTGANQWDDPTSDPAKAITNAISKIRLTTNSSGSIKFFSSRRVWDVIRHNPKIIEYVRGSNSPAVLTKKDFVNAFSDEGDNGIMVDDYLVSNKYGNFADEGLPADIKRSMDPATVAAYNCFGIIFVAKSPTMGWGHTPILFEGTRTNIQLDRGTRGGWQTYDVLKTMAEIVAHKESGFLYTTVLGTP